MTAPGNSRRTVALLAAAFLAQTSALAAPPDDAPPGDAGRLKGLESPPGGWALRLPGRNGTEVVLPRAEAVVAGTGARQVLVFEVRLTDKPRAPVRMAFHVQNRQGWYYQTVRVRGIPSDRWWRIDIDFSAETSEWEAIGHARPWDALSARGIVRAGIRLFSQLPYEGALLVRSVRWEAGRRRARPEATVVDLRAPAGPVRPGGLWELSFRLSRPLDDPFDPERAGIACEIVTPEGAARRVPVFHYQDYRRGGDGRLVALGAPQWRVRFRPGGRGHHLYRLFIDGALDRQAGRKGGRREGPQAEGWFVAGGPAAGGGLRRAPPPMATSSGTLRQGIEPRAASPSFERFVLELGRDPDGPWRPELASEPAVLGKRGFRREAVARPERAWRPFIEWTARWGKWDGLGSYDMERAWEFDRVIEEAEAAGVSLPISLLDDEPFLEHGTYRWPLNPLSRGEGGPLAGPGEFFTSGVARDFFLRRTRYLVARWGHSPAVSGWLIASGLPASGVTEWHAHVGRELSGLVARPTAFSKDVQDTQDRERQASRPPPLKPVVSLHPFAIAFSRERKLGEFEAGRPAGWRLDAKDSAGVHLERAKGQGSGGGDALAITFPAEVRLKAGEPGGSPSAKMKATVQRPMDDDLFDFDYLTFDVRMPEGSGGVGRAQVVVRDRDLLWFEILAETPLRAGDWTRCVVDLTTAGSKLRAVDHRRPWGGYARSRVRELAIRIFPNGATPGAVLLDHVKLFAGGERARGDTYGRPEVSIVRAGPEEVGRFEKYEMVLDITPEFSNPFDPEVVALEVTFRREKDGKKYVVPGFFYEPYERRLVKRTVRGRLAGQAVPGEREVEELSVTGATDWRVRFAPPRTGRYTSVIRVKTPGKPGKGCVRAGPSFRCVKSPRKGFIRVASDKRYFEHSTGEVFYPIGPVMRSPSDARDRNRDPSVRDRIAAAETLGTYQFDEYFDAMHRAGANWIRMWLCSWWCGIEWYRKWPGYGGTGWYNMPNAWRLDHVIETAEASGIYIQLCLQNHGQASERVDHEWEYNPYNRYEPEAFPLRGRKESVQRPSRAARSRPRLLRPAGWVENARDFFRDSRVRKARRNYLRYVVARWGYSTNVLAWVLSSEVEFTGEYWEVQCRQDDSDWKSGRWPEGPDRAVNTLEWHRELARYLHEIDPAQHVVTTHFSHPIRGRKIWGLDELDFVQSNAYSGFNWWFKDPKGRMGPNKCVPAPIAMKQYWSRFMGHYGKPVLVGEWGGHWMRNPIHFLDSELHTGTWASIMTPMAGATGYWWWQHVHFRNRYGVYTAVGRFLEGEDRRGLGLDPVDVKFENDHGQLDAAAISNGRRADVYVYQVQHALRLNSQPPLRGATMVLPGMERGMYAVETWDTVKGEPTGEHPALAVAGELRFELPEVPGDIALKVRPIRIAGSAQGAKKRQSDR